MRKLTPKLINELKLRADAVTGEIKPAVFGIVNMNKEVVRKVHYGLTPAPEDSEPDVLIPERVERILCPEYDLIVLKGGRGSAKTRSFAAVMTELIRREGKRCVALRERLNSIQDSVYQEIVDESDRRGITGTHIEVLHNKINSFISRGMLIFRGMVNNVTGIKGLAGYDIAWMEEVENVSLISLDTLFPTIYRNENSQIWAGFNPRYEDDPSYTELVQPYESKMVDGVYDDGKTLVIEMNYCHNPWHGEKMEQERLKMMERDYERYLWIWEGKFFKHSNEQILFGKWEVREFTPEPNWQDLFGADFGFSQDPSTLIKSWYDEDDETLYIEHEAYMVGVDLLEMGMFYAGKEGCSDDQLAEYDLIYSSKYPGVPGAITGRIWADESRPDTIAMLRKNKGFDIKGAPKGPGSVEDGIMFLRGLKKIVLHPRCKNVITECKNYKWKVDPKTEKILSVPVDDYNHAIDAIRYSLNKQIRAKRGLFG